MTIGDECPSRAETIWTGTARGDQVRRVAVPDVVEPTLPDAGRTNASVSRWGLSGPPELVAEDQITIAIGVAGQRAGE